MKKLLVFGIFILFFAQCSKKSDPVVDNTTTTKVDTTGTKIAISAQLTSKPNLKYPAIGCAPDGAGPKAFYMNGSISPYGNLELDKSIYKITSCTYSAATGGYTSNGTSKFAIAPGDTIFTYDTSFGTLNKDLKGDIVGLISVSGGTGKFKGAKGSMKTTVGAYEVSKGITLSNWVGDITTY